MLLLKISAASIETVTQKTAINVSEIESINRYAEELRTAANSLIMQGQMVSAEKNLKDALQFCRDLEQIMAPSHDLAIKNKVLLEKIQFNHARTYSSLGWLSREQTKFDDALEYFVRALSLFEQLKDASFCSANHSNIGVAYTHLGLFDKALEEFEKASALLAGQEETTEIKGRLASNMVNIGVIQKHLGLYDQALERYQQALVLLQDGDLTEKKANTLNNIALIYCLQGKPQESIFQNLEQTAQLTEDTFELAYMHQIKGMYYAREQSLEMARQEFSIAKELYSSNMEEVVEVMLLSAELELQSSTQSEGLWRGITILLEASEKVEQAKLKRLEKTIYSLMNKAYVAMEDYERANKAALRVISLQEDIHADQIKAVERHHKLVHGYDLLLYKVIHDELTGIYSRGYILDYIAREYTAATRTEVVFSLIMLDIDNFKKVNDTYGHVTGDVVLKKVAGVLKENVRSGDMVARYGGEEMLVLLWGTTATAAIDVAEKLREQVQAALWETVAPELQVTISLGLCDNKNAADSIQLIEKADAAMYVAKQTGKNRVCVAPIDPSISH